MMQNRILAFLAIGAVIAIGLSWTILSSKGPEDNNVLPVTTTTTKTSNPIQQPVTITTSTGFKFAE